MITKITRTKIRKLEQRIKDLEDKVSRLVEDRLALAKLASKKPQFFNPLEAIAAENLRDVVLRAYNLEP